MFIALSSIVAGTPACRLILPDIGTKGGAAETGVSGVPTIGEVSRINLLFTKS